MLARHFIRSFGCLGQCCRTQLHPWSLLYFTLLYLGLESDSIPYFSDSDSSSLDSDLDSISPDWNTALALGNLAFNAYMGIASRFYHVAVRQMRVLFILTVGKHVDVQVNLQTHQLADMPSRQQAASHTFWVLRGLASILSLNRMLSAACANIFSF